MTRKNEGRDFGISADNVLRILGSYVDEAGEAIMITEAGPIDPPGPPIIYVNTAFSRVTGYSREEAIGDTPGILVGPRTQPEMLQQVLDALTSAQPTRAELINYRKDGTEFWADFCLSPLRDRDGKVLYWAASIREITERKQFEEALRRSESINQALLNAMPDMMFRISREGVYLDFKSGKELEPLIPPSEFLGRSIPDVMPPDVAQLALDALRSAFEEGETQTIEYKLQLPGGVRDYETRIVVCAEDQALAVIRDITERKGLEQQLRQASKMEAVGRLAGGVAHDFNNLLTVIAGYAQMMLDVLPPGDSLREDVEEIAKAADRATALTQRLLAFSRRQIPQPRVIDLNSVVVSMNKLLRRVIGEGFELITVLRPDLQRIKAEAGQIEQILMNLVVNSLDAMPGGGRIVIETGNVELSAEYARTHVGVAPGSYVMLSVGDTGTGIAEDVRLHLFEPFFTTKEPGKGTGLGLSTVYSIVKQCGGDVEVVSEESAGTTIRIYFPSAAGEEAKAEAAGVVRRPLKGSETVLLVEDEAGVRRLLRELLLRQGYRVLEARDGGEALRVSSGHNGPIDLLVTDVIMPQMGGGELAQRMKGVRPDLKVLYVSGYSDDQVVGEDASHAGSAFLQKPFAPDTLLRKLREMLDVAGSPLQPPQDPSAP